MTNEELRLYWAGGRFAYVNIPMVPHPGPWASHRREWEKDGHKHSFPIMAPTGEVPWQRWWDADIYHKEWQRKTG